jgi:hypothetical protein
MSAVAEPQTPTDGQPAAPIAPEVKAPVAPATETKAPEQSQPEAKTEAPKLQGILSEPEKKAEAAKAPEKYEWKIQGEPEFVAAITGKFEPVAREAGLSNEQAHKVYDALTEGVRDNTQRMFQKWASALEADKDIGGDKLKENLGLAKTVVDKYGDSELRGLLTDAGLQYNPAVVRLLVRVAKDVSGDRLVQTSRPLPGPRSDAELFYPAQAQ